MVSLACLMSNWNIPLAAESLSFCVAVSRHTQGMNCTRITTRVSWIVGAPCVSDPPGKVFIALQRGEGPIRETHQAHEIVIRRFGLECIQQRLPRLQRNEMND